MNYKYNMRWPITIEIVEKWRESFSVESVESRGCCARFLITSCAAVAKSGGKLHSSSVALSVEFSAPAFGVLFLRRNKVQSVKMAPTIREQLGELSLSSVDAKENQVSERTCTFLMHLFPSNLNESPII